MVKYSLQSPKLRRVFQSLPDFDAPMLVIMKQVSTIKAIAEIGKEEQDMKSGSNSETLKALVMN